MAVQSRLENVLKTQSKYRTLQDIEELAEDIAAGQLAPTRYTDHQIKAARLAVKILGCGTPSDVLYIVGVVRPDPFYRTSADLQYRLWKDQQKTGVQSLSRTWAESILSKSNRELHAIASVFRIRHINGVDVATITSCVEVH